MLTQHALTSASGSRKKKRIHGRGDSSGRGSYSGRGQKGQLSRSGGRRRPGFEGGQTPLIRRMPKLKGFKNPNRVSYQIVNIGELNQFEDGAMVDLVSLYEYHLIRNKRLPVKVLGDGKLEKKLNIKVDAISKRAKQIIEEKGGTVTVLR